MLMEMIESLWLRIGPILNYDLRTNSSRVAERVQADHHDSIVAALKIRDAKAAEKALRADIDSAADYIVSVGALVSADNLPEAEVEDFLGTMAR